MRKRFLLAVDLSSKPGFARFVDGVLVEYGTLFALREYKDAGHYPLNLLVVTEETVARIGSLLTHFGVGKLQDIQVVLEETTGGHGYAIKKLEFLHCWLNFYLRKIGIVPHYIRDGVWKDLVGARQTKDEKNHNARMKRIKNKKADAYLKANPGADPKKVPSFRATEMNAETGKSEILRKFDVKDYSIRAVHEHFGIQMTREEEDAADAINIGWAYLHGAPICDGTDKGGLRFGGAPAIPKGQGRYHAGSER